MNFLEEESQLSSMPCASRARLRDRHHLKASFSRYVPHCHRFYTVRRYVGLVDLEVVLHHFPPCTELGIGSVNFLGCLDRPAFLLGFLTFGERGLLSDGLS